MSDCVLLGDRGYLSQSIQLDLFQTVNVKLETPKRINQKNYKPQPYIFRKSRKRILRIQKPKSKRLKASLASFDTRPIRS
mgnify:CR=1 FL=1